MNGTQHICRLPWPDRKLHPNARVHYLSLARVRKTARAMAWAALAATGAKPWRDEGDIAVGFTFHPPDRRKRDRDGLAASMKAAADGLADALGVDDARFVPTYRLAPYGEDAPGVVVTIEAAQ